MRHIPLFIEFTFNNQLFQLPRLMNKPEDATTLCMCMCNALVYSCHSASEGFSCLKYE